MWRDFVRSQIDNCMRIFAAFIAESQTDFIDGFFVGKKISDMKDNRGNKMKDYILRQRLAEYDAKLDLVYRNFSEYVHLAEKAFYSSVTTSSSEQYSVDGGEVKVGDLVKGEKIPEEVMSALEDEAVTKWAFNAQFERICISRMLGYEAGTYLVPASWKCSMVWSAYMGLPLSLEGVGAVLGLEKQKLTEGKDLILERQSQRTR